MIYLHESGPYDGYRLTDPTGKSYIGTTMQGTKERWKNGRAYANNPDLTAAIEKYGWENFKKEITRPQMSHRHAMFFERFSICKEHTLAPNGYNLNSGGDKNYYVSPITRERMRAAQMKPVAQLDPETGEILHVWDSLTAAGEALHIHICDISQVIHEERKTAGGYGWKLHDTTTAAGNPAAFLIESVGEGLDISKNC